MSTESFPLLLGETYSGCRDLFVETSDQLVHLPAPPFKLLSSAAETEGNFSGLEVRCTFKTIATSVKMCYQEMFFQ